MAKYEEFSEKDIVSDKGIIIIWCFILLALVLVIWALKTEKKLECFNVIQEWDWENVGDLPDRIVCIEGMFSCECVFYYWNGSRIEKTLMKKEKGIK